MLEKWFFEVIYYIYKKQNVMSPDNSYASGVVVDRLSSLTEAFQAIMYFFRGFLIPILVVLNCHWFSIPSTM